MDFVKKKIITRSLTASLVPVSVYTCLWAISMVIGNSFDCINLYALAALSITSFIYPFNYIGLFLLFEPLNMLWEHLLLSARKA
jgi:hypothetical protein